MVARRGLVRPDAGRHSDAGNTVSPRGPAARLARFGRVRVVSDIRPAVLRMGLWFLGEASFYLLAPARQDTDVDPGPEVSRSSRAVADSERDPAPQPVQCGGVCHRAGA